MQISGLRKVAWSAPLFALALASLSCGGAGGTSPPPVGTSSGTGYFFIADAPPAGTSVLKFEITLSGATLCPTVGTAGECQGTPQVSLLDSPLSLDLDGLQLGSAFLSSKSVQVGTYAGVKLTFSDYDLKVMLPDGTIKELTDLTVPLLASSLTPTFSSGLTVANNTSFGFVLDFNANNSIQSTATAVTGVSPVVNLVQLPLTTQQPIIDLAARKGRVSSLTKTCTTDSGSFTLTDSLTGAAIANISFDSTTLIGEPTDATAEKDITCATFANNQIVEVDILARTNAQNAVGFFARQIQLVGAATAARLQGTVFQVNTASEFVLFVESRENLSTVPTGSFITVSFDPLTAVFRMDAGDLPVVATDFDAGSDLLAGQKLKLDVTADSLFVATTGCKTVADLCTAQADGLRLKQTTLSGRVADTANDPDFTIDKLPSILGLPPGFLRPLSADCQLCLAGSVQVSTSSATAFGSGLTNVSSLAVNNIVEVRGLLIKSGFTGPGPTSGFPPTLVATQVRLQP